MKNRDKKSAALFTGLTITNAQVAALEASMVREYWVMNWRLWTLRDVALLALLIGFILGGYLIAFGHPTWGCNWGFAKDWVCSVGKAR